MVSVLLVSMTSLVAIASPAHATNPEVILARPRAGEYQPIKGEGWLAWQNSTRRPRQYDVFVRDVDGGPTTRVNPAGTNGANGDIGGDVLVYQQFEEGRSGVRFFELTTGERGHPPKGVNSEHWEYWPTMSDRWLLFGRLARRSNTRRVILFDLSTGEGKTLAKVRGRQTFLAPGQVSGDWAVWSRCTARSPCNVVRYQISTGKETSSPIRTGGTITRHRWTLEGRCSTCAEVIAAAIESASSDSRSRVARACSGASLTETTSAGPTSRCVHAERRSCTTTSAAGPRRVGRLAVRRLGLGSGGGTVIMTHGGKFMTASTSVGSQTLNQATPTVDTDA